MHSLSMRASYLWRQQLRNLQSRRFGSQTGRDELSIEEEADRKIGWLLKLLFAGTASTVAYQLFPYLGSNLMQQSVSLLQVKDPLFKRMGASRLARFAKDAGMNYTRVLRTFFPQSCHISGRMKIVEMGGAQELINMLVAAKDDRTRKEALKALAALAVSDEAAGALHCAGANTVINSPLESSDDAEVIRYKSSLQKRFADLRFNLPT